MPRDRDRMFDAKYDIFRVSSAFFSQLRSPIEIMRRVPYQPFLFRLLHGISSILAIAAVITGFWVYSTYDGRWGRVPLPLIPDMIGIHGTIALTFLIVIPAFAIYSFHAGQKRLIQPDSFTQLQQVGKPIWWYSLQRIANTLMLLAATFCVITGRMMKEEWLPRGELNHIWYFLHLIAWAVIVCCLAIHVLMSAKVGGLPLLLSVLNTKFNPEDSPKHWLNHIRTWLRRPR